MIRKLLPSHIDKVAEAANQGKLISLTIYKADSGKHRGSQMIDYVIDKDQLSDSPNNKEAHGQLIKALREIRPCLLSSDYKSISLDYSIFATSVTYRIVAKK